MADRPSHFDYWRPTSFDYQLPSDEEIARARQAGELICRCPDPAPDVIGECSHCRRLVASTVSERRAS